MRQNVNFMTISLLATMFITGATAQAATSPSAPNTPATSTSKTTSNQGVLWDRWYTVTVESLGKPFRAGYYNDRFETKDGKLFYFNKYWKNEEGHLNEEAIGAIAIDDASLTPYRFNYRSLYRNTETLVNGNFEDGRKLTVNGQRGEKPLTFRPIVPYIRGTILSGHFPIWLSRRISQLERGKWMSFGSIMEDSHEKNYPRVDGRVRWEGNEERNRVKLNRITVDFNGVTSVWYVDDKRVPYRIEIPKLSIVVQRVEQADAEKFLDPELGPPGA